MDREAGAVGGRTLLLVVNGEHAIAIAKRLRWPVVGGFVTNDFGLSDTEIDLFREHRNPFQQPPSPAIVTFEGLARYDLAEISTIIRADGGSGLPPIERHRLTCRPGTAPLAIVDIDGDRAHVLRRAARQHTVITQNRWVIAIDDVRKAFDNVSIADAMNDHREYITDTSLLALIEAVLQGSDGPRRRRGIDQGAAYSPAVMNLRLHRTLDVEVERRQLPPCWRFVDNNAFVCRSVKEGERALKYCRKMLVGTGLCFKGQDGPPADLNRGSSRLTVPERLRATLAQYRFRDIDLGAVLVRWRVAWEGWDRLEKEVAKKEPSLIPI